MSAPNNDEPVKRNDSVAGSGTIVAASAVVSKPAEPSSPIPTAKSMVSPTATITIVENDTELPCPSKFTELSNIEELSSSTWTSVVVVWVSIPLNVAEI